MFTSKVRLIKVTALAAAPGLNLLSTSDHAGCVAQGDAVPRGRAPQLRGGPALPSRGRTLRRDVVRVGRPFLPPAAPRAPRPQLSLTRTRGRSGRVPPFRGGRRARAGMATCLLTSPRTRKTRCRAVSWSSGSGVHGLQNSGTRTSRVVAPVPHATRDGRVRKRRRDAKGPQRGVRFL